MVFVKWPTPFLGPQAPFCTCPSSCCYWRLWDLIPPMLPLGQLLREDILSVINPLEPIPVSELMGQECLSI